ncbi:MarR family winged helix-turn-helix transcriptional regulator [Tabrizicola sp.]|uniref:MarR family winged helix-turn-helix transcriptional regulator n=1 Tax=Tabrizicola sp. TaxID=2005166 RepID=UPI003F671C6A
MHGDSGPRTLNMLGALALALADRIGASAEATSGLHVTAASALVVITNHPGEPVDAIRRALGLTHSGAVRLVDGLEAAGLVERRRSDRDGRAIALWPTRAGERTASEITLARARLLAPMLARTEEADRKVVVALLETALAALTDSKDQARSICRFCEEGICRPQGCPVERAASGETT